MIQHFLPMLLCFTTLYGSDYFTSQSTCPEDDLRTRFENQWNSFSQNQIDSINAYTAYSCYSQFFSSNPDFATTIPQTIDALIERGSSQIDAEKYILNQHNYYCSPSFREQIKTFSSYRSHIKELHSHLVANKGRCYQLRKALGFVHQGYQDLLAITETLHDEILAQEAAEMAARQEAHKRHAREKTQRIRQEEMVRTTFASQKHALQGLGDEWRELSDIYQDDDFVTESRFERRIQTLQAMEDDGYVCETKTYTLSPQAAALLHSADSDPQSYRSCYGNQLQQVIHQECIDGIEDLSILSTSSIAYPYKDGIAQCIDSARDYNQAGMIEQASTISDFCWTFLDYGKALAEGAFEGAIGAVNDIIEHPGHALLCAVAGEYVLAYQLSKVVYNVADIGITYLIDAECGKQKWDDYVAPVAQLIDAISNKEITLRDTIKGAAHLAVGWKAQEKLLGGLGKICKTAKIKALEYAKNNPLTAPEQYMATPEGFVHRNLKDYYAIEQEASNLNNIQLHPQGGSYRWLAENNESCRVVAPRDEEKAWHWAEQEYERIRLLSDDVEKIARNTRKSKSFVTRIKNHVFHDATHKLDGRIGRLDPDPEIASAWDRLYHGDFITNDIKLLEHEYFESKLEKIYRLTLRQAHTITQSARAKPWYEPKYQER